MYYPQQNPVDPYAQILLDPRCIIADPLDMTGSSIPPGQTNIYNDESQKCLRLDQPTIRRPSSTSSLVTESTCSTPLGMSDMSMMRNAVTSNMQDILDTLRDEWNTVDLVFRSMQNAFPVRPLVPMTPEERLGDIDRELSIAHDELMIQVRRLHRRLNKLSRDMAQYKQQQTHRNPAPGPTPP